MTDCIISLAALAATTGSLKVMTLPCLRIGVSPEERRALCILKSSLTFPHPESLFHPSENVSPSVIWVDLGGLPPPVDLSLGVLGGLGGPGGLPPLPLGLLSII